MAHSRRALVRFALGTVLVSTLAACGSSSNASNDTNAAPGDTTASPATPTNVYPLLGTPVTDPAAAARPAIACKIDNPPQARPQTGLNKADMVYEENVEALTRFAAVFQSQGSDPVGPLRSGRTQDIDMLGSLNKPMFCWSGGSYRVTYR